MPKFWHKNECLILFGLAAFSIASSFAITNNSIEMLNHALISDYAPFIVMLFVLFMLGHGIHIKIKAPSNTFANVIFLAICSVFSSFIGTTGASVLFLRPYLQMNKDRYSKSHLIVFFIFLVSNIGGLLSPLGDPPLLLGYLHGVDFSWCFKSLFFNWLGYVAICLSIMSVIDKIILKKETQKSQVIDKKVSISVDGYLNVFFVFATVVVLFIDIKQVSVFSYVVPGILIKNIILLIFCVISHFYSKKTNHPKIDFSPFKEVARTFFVIFIVIAPVLFILQQHAESIHKYIAELSHGSDGAGIYFLLCGATSSFLDNAPSYLLFFDMAGGNARDLMNIYPNVLKAISISAVVMGAMTYIGNAPNMMVRSIAEKQGIKMPSFVGFMGWSCLIILPLSLLMSFVLNK